MKIVRGLLSITLLASIVFGTWILATDMWLWNAAPTHAYGLIVFVLFDLALLAANWNRARLATLGALLVATIQFVAMLSDTTAGMPSGVTSVGFRNYLLMDTSFSSLLVVQGVIVFFAAGSLFVPLFHGHRLTLFHTKKH